MTRPDSPVRMQTGKRTPITLKPRLDRTLLAYVAAASAAGVSLLALTEPSQAEVVFTPTNQTISPGHLATIDLNGDGITDFVITAHAFGFKTKGVNPTCGGTTCIRYSGSMRIKRERSNLVVGAKNFRERPFAKAFALNSKVGSSDAFLGTQTVFMQTCFVSNDTYEGYGGWRDTTRFLGLKLVLNGQNYFGWARVTEKQNSCRITATLTGYAYETTPNTPILAGQRSGNDASIEPETAAGAMLEPASLGRLARGAASLAAWRGNEGQRSGK
jgi:hypothetical protein